MEKILMTGGKGFFCTRLSNFYKDKYEILALGREELDIVDSDKVLRKFKEFKPDYVVHAAAIAVTDFCDKHPKVARKINVDGAVNVAKACKEVNAKLIFISSEQVFNGNVERGPYDENSIPNPNTVYGQNKLEAEELLKDIIDELWILRFTWQFGLPERGFKTSSNILWGTIESIIKGEKIKAPVNEYRGMTYVYEMIEQFDKVFSIPYGTYHVGSRNDLSRYDVVKLIIKEMGLEHRIDDILEADTEKYKDNPRDIRVNTEKISKYGITFGTTEEGIKRCLNEYKLKF